MSEIRKISDVLAEVSDKHRYHEFLRIPAMSAGVYVLAAGATDGQNPHQEDEIYFVIRGRSKVRLGREERDIKEGDVIFVEKNLEHSFFDVIEELVLLVFFSPAETS